MRFINCSLDECRKVDFECHRCSHFDKYGSNSSLEPYHPILNIPMSKVLTE